MLMELEGEEVGGRALPVVERGSDPGGDSIHLDARMNSQQSTMALRPKTMCCTSIPPAKLSWSVRIWSFSGRAVTWLLLK